MVVGNETYIIPRGWCRFGLYVPPLISEYNGVWANWANAYHGTDPEAALSIIRHGQLLIPGDITMDGQALHGCDSPAYFVSPHICYASHSWYSKIKPFRRAAGKQYYGQVVIAVKIRPGVYAKKRETEGGAKITFDDYSIIPENEIEWYSTCRGSLVPYGVLFRVFDEEGRKTITRL